MARVAPLAGHMGITRLGDVTGLDPIGMPVAVAVRPNSRSVAVSAGKGPTRSQAFASALMEAVELFHGEDILAPTRMASFLDLTGQSAVDPSSLRGAGAPLSPRTRIRWVEGYDLLGREPCWVPWDVVHTDFTLPASPSAKHFRSGSNGIGSGNHLVEALNSAISELVERDAVALWHARPIDGRAACRLDPASVDDQDCRLLLGRYERAGLAPYLWDVTSDVGIPVYICDIPASHAPAGGLRRFRGAGCHPDRRAALARAVMEAAQVRLTYVAGIRDDLPPEEYDEAPLDEQVGAALLYATSQDARPRLFHDAPTFAADDLGVELQWMLDRLRSSGIERVVAVDLTRPEFGIPVVRVVAPGLEWDCSQEGYAPGARARRASGLAA